MPWRDTPQFGSKLSKLGGVSREWHWLCWSFGRIYACFRIRFTAEPQRSQRQIFLLIQSRQGRDGDWIRNLLPSGLRSSLIISSDRYNKLSIRTTGIFLFGGISPPNKDFLLRVLGVSAVKILFWAGINLDIMRKRICHSDGIGREFIIPTVWLAKGLEPEDILEQEQER